MILLIRVFVPIVLASFAGQVRDAQAVKPDHPRTASVSGRVTIGGNPAVGIQVALVTSGSEPRQATTRAMTDGEGHFLLDSLASGYYTIHVVVSGAVAVQGQSSQGRRIALQEAAKLENIDFALVAGGVITGRVTDGDGSPITNLSPTLKVVDEKGRSRVFYPCPQESDTDDRGIYRIYGLPPGRYIIGFGREWDGPTHEQHDVWVSGQLYALTYYPGVIDEPGSKPVEVTAGSEITGIDIRLTAKKHLFRASGTVVDADTGAPIAGAEVSHGRLWEGGGEGPNGSLQCDSGGRFKFDRLQTGKHLVKLSSDYSNASSSFCDQVIFEIADGDVDGLEVKVHHGSAISGVVVPASVNDEKTAAVMANREVYASRLRTNPDSGTLSTDWEAQATTAADRSFRLAGLPPGKYRLELPHDPNDPRDSFCIQYIEVPGVGRLMNMAPYPPGSFEGDPIEIGDGQSIQDIRGVRIALATVSGVIRGQVRFEGGSLPQNAAIDVSIVRLPASDTRQPAGAAVDADGRFVIRSLAAGQYVIRAAAYMYPATPEKDGSGMKVLARTSETVTIADGQEATLTLTLNLGHQEPPK